MRGSIITAGVIVGGAVVAMAVGGGGAGASPYQFVGYAGGSTVRAVNNTVTSDLTAASNVQGQFANADTNRLASVSVPSLLKSEAVSTSSAATEISGGYQVVSEVKVAHVNALGGAITATAIDTTATSRIVNGRTTSTATTKFVGLKVAGIKVPVNVPKNYIVTIPHVATVALNYSLTGAQGQSVMTIGIGAYISLLSPRGSNGIGAEVSLNPTYAAIGPVTPPPSGVYLGGKAYGTQVTAKAGSLAGVRSDATAPISLLAAGTGGKTKSTGIAGVNLSSAARVGAVTNTALGTNTASVYDARTTSKVAGVNLLNGLIKADAVTAAARVHGAPKGRPAVSASSGLVNLSIGGKTIPVNAKPNTVVRIANLATVTVNQQTAKSNSVTVRALDVKLSTAAYGLPAGAEIQVATASASAS